MATSEVSRLAPANARDGVDTRTKDLTTRSGAGDREQDVSNAVSEFDMWLVTLPHVNLDLVAPAGAEVEGAPLWGVWGRYETVAKRRMEDSDESFRWVSYQTQVERAEEELLCCVPESRQMDMVYLSEINRAIASVGHAITRARRDLAGSPYMLDFHKTAVLSRMGDVEASEAARMDAAVRRIQAWVRSFPTPPCRDCGMWRCQEDGRCEWCIGKEEQEEYGDCACGAREYMEGMCADCFWEEDARIKREARALRPPPPIRIPSPRVEESDEEEEDDDSHMFEREAWGPRVYC